MSAPVAANAAPPSAVVPASVARARRAAADRHLFESQRLRAAAVENAFNMQDELQHRKYTLLESQLAAVQAKSLKDLDYELLIQDAATFTEGSFVTNPVDKVFIDAWLRARPNSPWAHYAEGLRWSKQAWTDRGDGWASQVTDAQWRKVRVDEVHARKELRGALALDPKLVMAWLTLMDVDQTDPDGGLTAVTEDYRDGTAQLPASLLLADRYIRTLEPYWFGSTAMMADFARSKLADLDKNPRFWGLQGLAYSDEGCTDCDAGRWDDVLRRYQAALAFEDRSTWLAAAGLAAVHLHRYGLAHEYYARANIYKPGDITLAAYTKFLGELCDHKLSAARLSSDMKEAVARRGVAAMDYLGKEGDCTFSPAELPWGDEPIPDVGGLHPYGIGSRKPLFQVVDHVANFPVPSTTLESPDSRYVVRSVTDSGQNRLQIEDTLSGRKRILLDYGSGAQVAWNPASTRIAVSDGGKDKSTGLDQTNCRIYDAASSRALADALYELNTKVRGFGALTAGKQLFVSCPQWWDQDTVMIMVVTVEGKTYTASQKHYQYNVVKKSFHEWIPPNTSGGHR